MEHHLQEIQRNRELFTFLSELFSEHDLKAFLEATRRKLPTVIRVNTLKASEPEVVQRLQRQGFVLENIPGIPAAYRIREKPYPIGKTLEHFLGYVYVQELASMLPPVILGPRPHERVLDLAAAPGSKTTQMAQMMENTGVIVANDVDVQRMKALTNNLDRSGVINTVLTQVDGYKLGFWLENTFDRVLLDAPCSALGTLHKTYEILKWWSWGKVGRLVRTQKGLILAAYRALRPGGVMVYSTCTLVPEENEGVVQFLKERHPEAQILPIPEIPGFKTRPGFTRWKRNEYPPETSHTLRVYPQDNLTEGFFIARISKPENG